MQKESELREMVLGLKTDKSVEEVIKIKPSTVKEGIFN